MAEQERKLHLVPGAEGRTLGDLGDDDLMLLVKAGRKDAFETLIRRYQEFVFGFAARFLGDRSQGRDVAQDVFLALWAERDRYQARGSFKGLLFTMARNRCHVTARGRRTQRTKLDALGIDPAARPTAPSEPIDELVAAERARLVQSKLAELPEKMRQALILRYTNGLQLDEIASVTCSPLGSVKATISRGLKRLGRLFEQEAQ
ncbi:MAG: RNA polymerase sigma factor [Deltaproteobacteria bacterium]|nr:RNA polymerase sigma factor [Deltaproteobacteria bacterium]